VNRRVVVTGVGTVNPAVQGDSAAVAAWLAARPAPGAAAPRRIDDRVIERRLDGTDARRLSRVCRLTVVAARTALGEAALPGGDGLGLVVGTELGDLRSTREFADGYLGAGPNGCSPLLFPNTVMNAMAAATSITVGARALSLTLNAPTVAGELAVAYAASAVAGGRVTAVLAGGVDELDGLAAEMLAGLGDRGDRGEGATFLVLEAWEHARARGVAPLAEIRGIGWRALPAPPHGVGRTVASRAVDDALTQAACAPATIGRLYPSTNGDVARDRWEAGVLQAAGFPSGYARDSLTDRLGHHAGLGALRVAAAAWAAGPAGSPSGATGAPGLVHGLARGGTHVAIVVGPPPA
jgi:3-oxoacyl-(acyl-carrier-protein) synthase